MQNLTHDNLVKRLFVSDAADDRLDFFSGDVEWGHVLFPVNVSLLLPEMLVLACNRKVNSPATIPAKGIGKFLTHAYAACELCFPKEHKALHHACRHVCGYLHACGVVCTRRCAAAHEGTRADHFCTEHGSPLKRNLDALEEAASGDFPQQAEPDDLDIDAEFESFMQQQDPDSVGVEDSDV